MALLAKHPDFDVLVRNTAADLKLLPELVLKDYWVTATLRVLATTPELQGRIIFKGGTSLSKGWHLIDRFSEDIDILTTGPDFGSPPESGGQRGRFLKTIRDSIPKKTPLKIPDIHDPFYYLMDKHQYYAKVKYTWVDRPDKSKLSAVDTVYLEMGFRGGPNPHSTVKINSFVGEFMIKQFGQNNDSFQEWADDFQPFAMDLLEPSQTFIEKLLYLHTAVPKDIREVRTRHIYDVVSIFQADKRMAEIIKSGGYKSQLQSAVEISNRWYGTTLDADAIDFKVSPVLNLTSEQSDVLTSGYVSEKDFYFRGQRLFPELLEGLKDIRRQFEEQSN